MGLVYLAGPMDYNEGHLGQGPRNDAARLLAVCGYAVFDPTGAYASAADPVAVMGANDSIIERSDGLLAIWPPDVMSVGTPMEIQTAHRLGKPTVVVGPTRSMQLQALGIPVFPIEALEEAISHFQALVVADRTPGGTADYFGGALKYVATEALGVDGPVECEPRRAYPGDAGFDVFVSEDVLVPAGGYADIPHGVSVELPAGTWGLLTGRSSTLRNRGLQVYSGVVDNGFRGELQASVWNHKPTAQWVLRGERIAQLVVLPISACPVQRVGTLSPSERGHRKLGSSGT